MEFLAPLFGNATVHTFVTRYAWVWPICEIIHFVGMALLLGTVGLIDLRLLGVAKGLPVAPIARLIPWGVTGFAMSAITGYLFIAGTPEVYLHNNLAFKLKVTCLLLAGMNVLAFYLAGISRAAEALGPGDEAPTSAKVIAAVSLVLWIGVIYFGRMLMYTESLSTREYYSVLGRRP